MSRRRKKVSEVHSECGLPDEAVVSYESNYAVAGTGMKGVEMDWMIDSE